MANNRIYIKCKICGEKASIAKFYPGRGFILKYWDAGWYSTKGHLRNLNKFFTNHHHDLDKHSMYGGWQYEFEYEEPAE